MSVTCTYDYLCVIDFEATCLQLKKEEFYPHEIIEFPAVLIDPQKLQIVSTFHSYVKPIIHHELSAFCKELTGITQDSVNNADTFQHVFSEFLKWLYSYVLPGISFKVVTDGSWDLRKFLTLQCFISNIKFPEWANDWIDIKSTFMYHHKRNARLCLTDMLHTYDLGFEGRLHSGKDDAYNIAQLVLIMLKKGIKLVVNGSIYLPTSRYLRGKLHSYLKAIEKKKNQSKRNLNEQKDMIEENWDKDMDIDPDLMGHEHVLMKHKSNS